MQSEGGKLSGTPPHYWAAPTLCARPQTFSSPVVRGLHCNTTYRTVGKSKQMWAPQFSESCSSHCEMRGPISASQLLPSSPRCTSVTPGADGDSGVGTQGSERRADGGHEASTQASRAGSGLPFAQGVSIPDKKTQLSSSFQETWAIIQTKRCNWSQMVPSTSCCLGNGHQKLSPHQQDQSLSNAQVGVLGIWPWAGLPPGRPGSAPAAVGRAV